MKEEDFMPRDLFAAFAMFATIIANKNHLPLIKMDDLAKTSYRMADEMLKAASEAGSKPVAKENK